MSAGSSSQSNGWAPRKKSKLAVKELDLNSHLKNEELLNKLHYHWENGSNYSVSMGSVEITGEPFIHVEIKDFVAQASFMEDMKKVLASEEVEFYEKSSDLFKFRQSNDLVSVSSSQITSLRNLFETKVLDFMNNVTGLPLNGKVDMFLSDYRQTDYLLCHDDELESRRIAFILYLSKEWSPDYGGSLDLFSSSDEIQPLAIVKSINPSFNTLVFFNVTSRSFHQVAEVVAPDKRRLALSGWFYGEPLLRIPVSFPPPASYSLHENISATNEKLENFLTAEYCNPNNYPAINASLEEFSIVKLKLFLTGDKHTELCQSLNKIDWEEKGQANLSSFSTPILPFWPHENALAQWNSIPAISKFIQLFHSTSFLEFIEKITEFEILTRTRVSSASLRRFQHRNYVLLKTNTASTGDEAEEEGEEWEIAPNEETDDDDETNEVEDKDKNDSGDVDEEESEDENAEMEIDVVYYCGEFTWDESMGAQTVYADADGQQLLTLTPEPNTLGIVVREKAVNSYVTYINCLAQKEKFYSFSFTITGFKN